ncbi:MAG: DEAD/DEAH box helicase family protein [Bacteriovoracaceae bacterium]|nr:DEAD/DEAH box helicase family protein [Bacteriovoracaceae bacterium]
MSRSRERIIELELKLEAIDLERSQIVGELLTLQTAELQQAAIISGNIAFNKTPITPEEKINLFLSLFRGRKSVYPKFWENQKQDRKGYSPACHNEWVYGLCGKPPKGKIKCSDCPNQKFPALDEIAVKNHLQGLQTIGTYAITENDTCIFLAADFDGDGWQSDIMAYKRAALGLGVQSHIERSRSGNGGHAWIFFTTLISAQTARRLGTAILSRAQQERHTLSLKSYDRFFPNQDYLPKGGFGNLIALPLQQKARENNNSVFVDENFNAYPNQWEHLAQVKRLSLHDVQSIIKQILPAKSATVPTEDDEHFTMEVDQRLMTLAKPKIFKGLFCGNVEIEHGAQLKIQTQNLPGALVSALKRTATFANPKFYALERMRFKTFPESRFIFDGEFLPDCLILPRGVLDQCVALANEAGAQVNIRDIRPGFKKIKFHFSGELQLEQKTAVQKIINDETGILSAPPGIGKTVMACAILAKRKMPTLILVHRQELLEQWKEQLCRFLNIPVKEIGVFSGAKKKLSFKIDIATILSLKQIEDLEDFFLPYGQIIIDECHHIPAVTFESILKRSPARFILGLTATPYRKDGHQKIMFMQCGPIRHEIKTAGDPLIVKKVIVKETCLKLPEILGPQPAIHLVWDQLIKDAERLKLIAKDVVDCISESRFPLVISDRKEHLEAIEKEINNQSASIKVLRLEGSMGKKKRKTIMEEVKKTADKNSPICLLATASLIGEGVDIPRLDTLVLAMPISFKGRMVQYAGRLHRKWPGKNDVVIYDYLDSCSGLTVSMYRKRLHAYKSMSYQVQLPGHVSSTKQGAQGNLFES